MKAWFARPAAGQSLSTLTDEGDLILDFRPSEPVLVGMSMNDTCESVAVAFPGKKRTEVSSLSRSLRDACCACEADDVVVFRGSDGSPNSAIVCSPAFRGKDNLFRLPVRGGMPHHDMPPDVMSSMMAHAFFCEIQAPCAHDRISRLRSGEQCQDEVFAPNISETDLPRITAELLRTDGYVCRVSPPGRDGGVDIIAGKGVLEAESSLVVQVKSGRQIATAPQLRDLIGVMELSEADRCLFVSWSGFVRECHEIAAKKPFRIRLWTGDDVIRISAERREKMTNETLKMLGL